MPNQAEVEFLRLAFNRFYIIFDEVTSDIFWRENPWYRLSKIKDGFSIYSELLNYPPIKVVLEAMKKRRPPMEAEIAEELFRFIRNVVMHFPFFNNWDEIYVTKKTVNWYKDHQSIDRFLNKFVGYENVKYRFWEENKRSMTYLEINFPKQYDLDTKLYLKDFLSEENGVKFAFILMRKVLDSQVLA